MQAWLEDLIKCVHKTTKALIMARETKAARYWSQILQYLALIQRLITAAFINQTWRAVEGLSILVLEKHPLICIDILCVFFLTMYSLPCPQLWFQMIFKNIFTTKAFSYFCKESAIYSSSTLINLSLPSKQMQLPNVMQYKPFLFLLLAQMPYSFPQLICSQWLVFPLGPFFSLKNVLGRWRGRVTAYPWKDSYSYVTGCMSRFHCHLRITFWFTRSRVLITMRIKY